MGLLSHGNFNNDIPGSDSAAEVAEVINQIEQKVGEAVNVLRELTKKSKKKVLFPEVDHSLHMQCVYKKPGTVYTGHRWKRIILPHPLHQKDNTTICLMMRNLNNSMEAKRDPDVDKQARQWAQKLESEYGVTKRHVQKILTKQQLEREYHSYPDRRHLASAYDIFLVDDMVERSISHFCGKDFYRAKKIPLRLQIRPNKSVLKQIEKAYYTILFPLLPFRTRISLRVGNLSNSNEQIVENVRTAVGNVFKFCPGGFPNIRSLNLQLVMGGPSLPFYIDAGPRNLVKLPLPLSKEQLRKKRKKEAIIDELSTLPEGMEVAVHKYGEVEVLDSSTKKRLVYPTVDDEWEKGDDLKPRVDLKKRKKLREKYRRKMRGSKKRLLFPVKEGTLSMKGLLKKNSQNKLGDAGSRRKKKTEMTDCEKSISKHRIKIGK